MPGRKWTGQIGHVIHNFVRSLSRVAVVLLSLELCIVYSRWRTTEKIAPNNIPNTIPNTDHLVIISNCNMYLSSYNLKSEQLNHKGEACQNK